MSVLHLILLQRSLWRITFQIVFTGRSSESTHSIKKRVGISNLTEVGCFKQIFEESDFNRGCDPSLHVILHTFIYI